MKRFVIHDQFWN